MTNNYYDNFSEEEKPQQAVNQDLLSINRFLEKIKENAEDVSLYYGLACAYIRIKDFVNAEKYFNKIKENFSESDEAKLSEEYLSKIKKQNEALKNLTYNIYPISADDLFEKEPEKEDEEKVNTCFYHKKRKKEYNCQQCEKSLCKNCASIIQGKIYCPDCLIQNKEITDAENYKSELTVVDNIPLRIFKVTIIISLILIPIFYLFFSKGKGEALVLFVFPCENVYLIQLLLYAFISSILYAYLTGLIIEVYEQYKYKNGLVIAFLLGGVLAIINTIGRNINNFSDYSNLTIGFVFIFLIIGFLTIFLQITFFYPDDKISWKL